MKKLDYDYRLLQLYAVELAKLEMLFEKYVSVDPDVCDVVQRAMMNEYYKLEHMFPTRDDELEYSWDNTRVQQYIFDNKDEYPQTAHLVSVSKAA